MKDLRYILRRVSACIIGIVFFIAGSLKLMDPVGAGLVVSEYLKFFHLGFLGSLAKPIAVCLAFIETIVGVALVTGVWRKITAIATWCLVSFFTLLTLVIYIFNPEMDCGCFGEAIHLTHLQTFLKNIVLLLLCCVAFIPLKTLGDPRKHKYVAFYMVMAAVLLLLVYSLTTIPLINYTPFKPGVELEASIDNPTAGEDDFVSTFVYEKNGQYGSFTLNNLPDSTWTYVRTETIERNTMKTSDEILDINPSDSQGNNMEEMLTVGNVMAISVYNPEKLNSRKWNKIAEFISNAKKNNFVAMVLVSADSLHLNSILQEENVAGETKDILLSNSYTTDYKTLISLNRSNGGSTFFYNGGLIAKKALRNLQSDSDLAKLANSDAIESMLTYTTRGRLNYQAYLLYTLAAMLLI